MPSEQLTTDEQLLPSKSRCPFTQFLPNKPDKYGIKFFLLVDVKTKFLSNGFPYLGKHDPNFGKKPFGDIVVLELMSHITVLDMVSQQTIFYISQIMPWAEISDHQFG